MLGLDQNLFVGTSKRYLVGNDFNGILIKFALENIFLWKICILYLFIFRINLIIAPKEIKSSKKTYRKNKSHQRKILGPGQGKKIKNFRSCSKCDIKGWHSFVMLFFVSR